MGTKRPDLEIDLETMRVRKDGKSVELSQTEWKMLRVLVQHKNKPVSHQYLLKAVWGDAYSEERNFLYSCMERLRKKLGCNARSSRYLKTVSGLGYRWVEPEADPNGDAPASAPEWHSPPPAPLTSFVGRERELAALEKRFSKRGVRLMTLTGPGGIGKTRLSVELAGRLYETRRFADGIHFVDLETIDSPELVTNAIAQAVGVRETAAEDLLTSLKRHLQGRSTLFVLDNFEHVQAAAPQILELMKAARDAKFLVTTRERFNLYSENNLEVPPLSLVAAAPGEPDPTSEAVQLFVDRAQAVDPFFELDADNAPVLQQICDRLEGLPLAIELAAARCRQFSLDELLERLNDQLQVLIGGPSNLPARHRTLQAAIDWSYQLLDAQEQRLFAALSVFNGSFTADAAEAVCASGDTAGVETAQTLASLRSKSLLRPHTDDSRHTMYGAFREYGQRLLDEHKAAKLGHLHAEYYECLLDQTNVLKPEQRIDRLSPEIGNLRAALNWALAHKANERALRLSIGMYELWLRLGNLREGRQRLFEVLDATEDLASPLRARALYCAGALAAWLGEHQIVQRLYRESLRLYEAAGDKTGTVSALLVLASALVDQGDYVDGRALSKQALDMARKHENLSGVALALNNLGMIATYQGDPLKARECYEEKLYLWKSIPYGQGMAWALTGLSWVDLLQGRYESAQENVTQSLDLYRQCADTLGMAIALVCEGWIALYRADLTEARSKLENSLALCRSLGLVNLSLWPLVGLARIDLLETNLPQARAAIEEALRLCRQLNDPPMTTWVYIAFGKLLRLEGDMEAAFDYLDRGLTLCRKRDDKSALAAAVEEFALHLAGRNRIEPAAKLLGAAEALRESCGLPLPAVERIELDELVRKLQSKAKANWNVHRLSGRKLDWGGIVQLIYHRT